jgi:hypothetical protein
MRLAFILFSVATLAGCASARYATEEVRPKTSEEREGADVAGTRVDYRLPEGARATVWSKGASADEGATAIHVALAFDNRGEEPIGVDPSTIELARVDAGRRSVGRVGAADGEGAMTIPAGDRRTISLRFELPDEIRPQDVDGFELRWSARIGDAPYTQTTPFTEDPALGQYDPLVERPARELGDRALAGQDYPGQPVVY